MVDHARAVGGGRYRLIRELGRGAMGVVWLASDELLQRQVAAKQLVVPAGLEAAAEARARAMREARIAARLHHPNAISVFDVVTEGGELWLVMEYLPSRSLAELLAGRSLAPADAARVGARVAAALAAAHELGIVHRDVKPGNILLGDRGTVKLADFGISIAGGDTAVTSTGVLVGTPAYLAPEVARGGVPAAPSDVFSLGATLYAAVEGEPPFGRGENQLALLHRVAAGEFAPPRLAGPLAGVLERLLSADPEARPTAAKAAELLGAIESSTPLEAGATTGTTTGDATGDIAEPPTLLMLGQLAPGGAWPSRVPREPRRVLRSLVPAVATAATLVAAAAVVAIALNSGGVAGLPAAGDAPSSTTAAFTPSRPPQKTAPPALPPVLPPATTTRAATATPRTAAVTTTTAVPATTRAFEKADVAAFLRAHYTTLPENTGAAWQNLTPEYRLPYPDYVAFWSGYDDVGLDGEPLVSGGGSAFTADIRIRFDPKNSTATSIEPYRVHVVVRDGRLLIDRTVRLGG